MRACAAEIVLSVAAILLLTACEPSRADDGVTQLCKERAQREPESNMDPDEDCACSASKLKDLLTDDHYQLLDSYSALLVDIALKNPDLRGRESYDRTLAALAEQRGESVSAVNQALSAGAPPLFVQLSEQICREQR